MTFRLKLAIFSSLTLASIARPAHAFDLSIVGGPNWGQMKPSRSSGASVGHPMGAPVVGAIMESQLFPPFGFEIAGLYTFNLYGDSNSWVEKTSSLTVPFLFRYHFFTILSFGLGGYGAYAIGDITTTSLENRAPKSESTLSYGASNRSRTDWGVCGSLAMTLPVLLGLDLRADLRLYKGLLDNATGPITMPGAFGNTGLYYSSIEVLMGAQFRY